MNELAIRRPGLGIVVQLGRWKIRVHYRDCADYVQAYSKEKWAWVRPGMELVACGHCHPPEEEIDAYVAALRPQVRALKARR